MKRAGDFLSGSVKMPRYDHCNNQEYLPVDSLEKIPNELIVQMMCSICYDLFEMNSQYYSMKNFRDFRFKSIGPWIERDESNNLIKVRKQIAIYKKVNKIWSEQADKATIELSKHGMNLIQFLMLDKQRFLNFCQNYGDKLTRLQVEDKEWNMQNQKTEKVNKWNVKEVNNLLLQCPYLDELTFGFLVYPRFTEFFASCQNTLLTALEFDSYAHNFTFDPENSQAISHCFPSLKKIRCNGIDPGVDFIKYFTSLTSLTCRNGEAEDFFLNNNHVLTNITTLKIRNIDLIKGGLQKAIESFPNLKKLSLCSEYCDIKLESLTTLPSELEHLEITGVIPIDFHHLIAEKCPLLKSLSMYNTADVIHSNTAVGKIFSNCTQLIALEFSRYQWIGKAFDDVDQLPNLEFLDLASSDLDDLQLVDILFKCPKLTVLNVRDTNVTDRAISLLIGAKFSQLETVYISQSEINLTWYQKLRLHFPGKPTIILDSF